VNVGREDFPALARKIRTNVSREITGDSVVGIRQAKSGGLLIEVRGDQARVEAVRAEIAKSAGPTVDVRSLQRKDLIELRDLDEWSTKKEVVGASETASGTDEDAFRVVSLRKHLGGSQSALVLAPATTTRKFLSAGRVRVGLVSCRVRQREEKVRCYRCHEFGHTARECEGPDKSQECWRCGATGHKAATCGGPVNGKESAATTVGNDTEPQ